MWYLKKIFDLLKNKKYKIMNLEAIFASWKNLYLNKTLDELCKLNEFVVFLRTQIIKEKVLEDFYSSIHTKGINSIKKGEFNTEKIINFMRKIDVYYLKD